MATGQLGAINDFKCLSPFDGVPHLKKKKKSILKGLMVKLSGTVNV